MVNLLDIAEQSRTVLVRGFPVTVPGVSARGIVYLMGRFPEVQKLLAKEQSFELPAIMALAPDIIAGIIAAGCGHPGEEDHEKVAAGLPASDQVSLLKAIIEVTMPDGLVPLLNGLTSAISGLGIEMDSPKQ